VVLGLLPALALACVLVGNLGAGRAAVEMLQVRGGGPLLVDVEPNQPMRIVGELEPEVERQWEGLRPFELGVVRMGSMLRAKMCSSECRSLMGAAECYTQECKKLLPDCNSACKNPNWEQKLLPCWDAVSEGSKKSRSERKGEGWKEIEGGREREREKEHARERASERERAYLPTCLRAAPPSFTRARTPSVDFHVA